MGKCIIAGVREFISLWAANWAGTGLKRGRLYVTVQAMLEARRSDFECVLRHNKKEKKEYEK